MGCWRFGTIRRPESGTELRRLFEDRIRRRDDLDALGRVALSRTGAADRRRSVPLPIQKATLRCCGAAAVAEWAGLTDLRLKHEGHNPTGSFKDRGMTVGVTQAVRIGARAIACASTGNTSAALAAYGAQAGIPALVFVPSGQVALGKLAQSLAYGAKTLLVRGDFDTCLKLVQEAETRLGRLSAELDQSVPPRGTEDDRAGAVAAAGLGAAGLDRAPGRQPRQHGGLRQGVGGGEGRGTHLADCRGSPLSRPRAPRPSHRDSPTVSALAIG